ncbi:hypothetical protein SISSUDRAFT_1037636 [Sistotremastrum suecicum HHB10207 ss-3]|uniref:JmjC domain-containing protein n=1 Tax=Sistotremastrum suecicum HHB10207 ss-3 TaxID=1314776 RepID=A0A165XV76_9AGAM|nr:hypothetical protein SISSUDRAFT_1037636 [Sistotremastrum suecicum HHB10207 ss-3]
MLCSSPLSDALFDEDNIVSALDLRVPQTHNYPDALDGLVHTRQACHPVYDPALHCTDYGPAAWAIAATAGAVTRMHKDASGCAMWLRNLCGEKLVAVYLGGSLEAKAREPDYDKVDPKWKVFVLRAGDYMFLPPGAGHIVATTALSVAEGGFFYSSYSFRRTLENLVQDHFNSRLCNSYSPALTSVLFPLWFWFLIEWKKNPSVPNWPERLPPLSSFAALMVILDNMGNLIPKLHDSDPYRPPTWPPAYVHDRDTVSKSIKGFVKHLKKGNATHQLLLGKYTKFTAQVQEALGKEPEKQQQDLWEWDDKRLGAIPYFRSTAAEFKARSAETEGEMQEEEENAEPAPVLQSKRVAKRAKV